MNVLSEAVTFLAFIQEEHVSSLCRAIGFLAEMLVVSLISFKNKNVTEISLENRSNHFRSVFYS
jgi:hypothetical protein